MSDKQILVADFDAAVAPYIAEASQLNKRLSELQTLFEKTANSVIPDPELDESEQLETFSDSVFDKMGIFLTSVDWENSKVEFGNVEVWESSNC